MKTTIVATAVCLSLVGLALADDATAAIRKPTHIEAQALGPALAQFARSRDLQVLYFSETIRDLRTQGASGEMTVDEALQQLLRGTGLSYKYLDDGTVTIIPPAVSGKAVDEHTAMLLSASDGAGGSGALQAELASFRLAQADGSASSSAAHAETPAAKGAESAKDADEELQTITIEAERARSVYTGFATSATKTTTPLSETPQAISVITRDWMDMQNIQHVEDALRYAAGVKTSPYGNDPRRDTFFIRGFDQSSDGLYRDGMRTPVAQYGSWRVEPYALERVEVMRGPSSVLYGQTSPGGIVNQMSKRPTARPVRSFTVEAGNFNTYQGAFDVGGAANTDETLMFRVLGLYRDADTQVDFVNNQRKFFAPSLTWKPADSLTWTLMAEYQADKIGKANAYPAVGTLFPNPNGKVPTNRFVGDPNFDHYDRDQKSATSLLTWAVSDAWTVRQNFRYGNLKLDYNTINPRFPGLLPDLRTYQRSSVLSLEDADVLTADTNAEGRFRQGNFDHTVLLGVDYQKIDTSLEQGFGTAPPLDIFNPVYYQAITPPAINVFSHQIGKQLGFYAQEHLKIAERFVVLVGGRYDDAKRSLNGNDDSQNKFTHREGLVWLTKSGISPYVSHATSFVPLYGTDIHGKAFVPETSQQYELGMKFQPVGRATSVMLALFDLRRQNIRTTDPTDPANVVQTGELRSRGVELETNYAMGPWNFLASGAYYKLETTKANDGTVGFRPFGVPKSFASAWANYEVPGGPLAGLGVGGGIRYIGSSLDSTNTAEAPSVTLFDLLASYKMGHWRAALNATNVTDKTYVSAVFNAASFAYYGNRRAVVASLTYTY